MFSGKSTIITGANKNLGKETAIAFAQEGSNILLHFHSTSSSIETINFAEELSKKYNIKTITYQGDLSLEVNNVEMFNLAIESFGKIDYAINNVGMIMKKKLVDITIEEYNKMISVNTTASFLFLREAERKVNENGSVVMLTTSLLAAYSQGHSIYQATKSAVYWMCKTASKETNKKITYNCISPGPMDTPFLHQEQDERTLEFLKQQAIEKRLTFVEDIVPIIKFIVKDGKWMTGQNLYANNGFLAPTA